MSTADPYGDGNADAREIAAASRSASFGSGFVPSRPGTRSSSSNQKPGSPVRSPDTSPVISLDGSPAVSLVDSPAGSRTRSPRDTDLGGGRREQGKETGQEDEGNDEEEETSGGEEDK